MSTHSNSQYCTLPMQVEVYCTHCEKFLSPALMSSTDVCKTNLYFVSTKEELVQRRSCRLKVGSILSSGGHFVRECNLSLGH